MPRVGAIQAPYRQSHFLRDFTLALYLFNPLTTGLQAWVLGGGQDLGGGSAINQAITLFMLASATVCVLYERLPARRLWVGALPFLIPLAVVVASYLWAEYASISARRILRFAIELAGLLLLVSCYRDTRSLLRALWAVFALLLVLDIAAVAMPRSFTDIGYAGIHGHKNTLGAFCYQAIPVFFFAWRLNLQGRWSIINIPLMLIGLGLLVLSQSKTAIALLPFIALITYFTYKVWLRGPATRLALGALFSAAVVVLTLPLSAQGVNLAEAVGAVTGDPTMTGRTAVWDYTFYRVGDRYLTGVGYGSFWDVDRSSVAMMREYGVTFAFNQSHNGYIGVYGELGALGLGAIALMWLLATAGILARAANAREWALVTYALYLSLGFLLYNLTETAFFRVGFDPWITYVISAAAVAKLVAPVTSQPTPQRRTPMRPAPRAHARPPAALPGKAL